MDKHNESLFSADAPEAPAELAASLAPPAAAGHYDELRGCVSLAPAGGTGSASNSGAARAQPTGAWSRFFENLGADGFADLNRRTVNLERQVRDNGVTYNVYTADSGPQRPWSLDLFPLIVTPASWAQIEAGVLQRVKLLDRIMADVYGPQQLLAGGFLPPALVQGHPGYLRAMQGAQPVGGNHLQIAAFDLARNPNGDWCVVAQRTQAPSGLGYLLENRLVISRLFPEAFADLRVQRLAATYRALVDGMKQMCPTRGEAPRIVLLTPGPYNETYFEHAYLARYLGLTLVEGSDLTVRDQRLYLKTLQGLEPVHGVLKRLDDQFLDPLELRADSRLGVPGLLQVVRAGNVLMANAPGSAFLESTALLGFLPALSRHLLGQELKLPSLPTWWCGERAAMESVLPRLADSVIKPTWPDGAATMGAVLGRNLSRRELDEWAGRIARQGDEHTVQAYLPLSQMPTWKPGTGGDRITPRSVMLRVFALADPAQGPQSWRVLPGGLARIATSELHIASMQHGGSSADVWVLTDGEVDTTSLLQHAHPAATLRAGEAQRRRGVTSRAAENLFWLGRYTERCENTVRLARLTLASLNGEDQNSQPLLSWLSTLAVDHALVLRTVPAATQARRVFERSLIAALADTEVTTGVGYNLRALKGVASAVRERLSLEQWNLVVRAEDEFFSQCARGASDGDYSTVEALRALESVNNHMAAMTGAQTDRMTRDDGWRLLSSGRMIERLGFLASSLARALECRAVGDEGGYEAVVALFDSTITFHAQYQQRHDMPALLDLLVVDRDNPRSIGWVAQSLRGRLAKLASHGDGQHTDVSGLAPDSHRWRLDELAQPGKDDEYPALAALLARCTESAWRLSDAITTQYFTHSADARQSLGA